MKKKFNENPGIGVLLRNLLYPNKVEIFKEQSYKERNLSIDDAKIRLLFELQNITFAILKNF